MNVKIFNEKKNKEVVLCPYFFSSQSIYKFRNIKDYKSQNTIVMVNVERATVYEAKDFAEYMDNLIDEGNVGLIVDMENVYFMDTIFFGTMVRLLKKVNKKNGYIKLIINYNNKPELLAIRTFREIFETYPNLFEAINSKK